MLYPPNSDKHSIAMLCFRNKIVLRFYETPGPLKAGRDQMAKGSPASGGAIGDHGLPAPGGLK